LPPSDVSLCLYPNGIGVVSERCTFPTSGGYSVFEYGPIPPQIDTSSFRAFFDDTDSVRLRDYHMVRQGASRKMVMGVDCVEVGDHPCTIIYQTGGFDWQVWYDCILSQNRATLSAWISISNSTPLTYSNIELRFVCDSPSGIIDDQRLFTTERQVVLGGMDRSNIELITVPEIPVLSRLVAPADSPGVYEDLFIRNESKYGLGIDLPSGPIRIYEKKPWPVHTDSGHFPSNTSGDDISIRNLTVDDVSINGGWNYDSGVADLYIRNDRDHRIEVQVEETEQKSDIIESTHQMVEADDTSRFFPVSVEPQSSGHLRYRVSAEALTRGRPTGYGMQTSPALTMMPVGSHLPFVPNET
jgi:hypothetical protein